MDGLLINPKPVSESTPLWAQVLYKFGVPSAIALYLVYSLVNGGSTMLANIERSQRQHMADTTVLTEMLREMKDSSIRTEGYLRLLCLNTAKNSADRATCLSLR